MTLFCDFCDELATYSYRLGEDNPAVGLCRWHLVLLYLGLHYEVPEP